MSVDVPRAVAAAPRALQLWWRLSCTAAVLISAAAVAVDLGARAGAFAQIPLLPRWLAAAALALSGVMASWAVFERRTREFPRRRVPELLLGVGILVLYLGQAVGYLLIEPDASVFPAVIEVVPLLVATPLILVGLVWLSWPPSLTRRDVFSVVRDTTMAALGLLVLWMTVVVPFTYASLNGSGQSQVARWDVWGQYIAVVALAMAASLSRRSGALPIPQPILLQGGALLYLVSDIVGHAVPLLDQQSRITYSIVGYCLAAYFIMSFAARPALQTDPPSGVRRRDNWSLLVPLLPVPLGGLGMIWYRVAVGPLPPWLLAVGVVVVVVAAVLMVTDRILLSSEIRRARDSAVIAGLGTGSEWFAALIGDTQDLVTVVDRDGMVLYQAPTVRSLLGYGETGLIGSHFTDIVHSMRRRDLAQLLVGAAHDPDRRGPFEVTVQGRDGRAHPTEMRVAPLRAQNSDGFVLTNRDVSDRRRLRAEFVDSSLRDPVTQLANREGFLARLRDEVPAATAGTLAVTLVDLRGFRALNDSRGHEAGDQILRVVAEAMTRLPGSVRAVGRTGPDEFGLLIVDDPVEPLVGEVAREITDALARVLLDDGDVVSIGVDIGYAVTDADGVSASTVVEGADLALAEARSLASEGPVGFDSAMRATLVERLRAEADLREAIDSQRLVVHYQPIVSLADGRIVGMEALARLIGHDGQLVPPDRFIPLAEDLGLIHRVGSHVLDSALRDVVAVSEVLGRPLWVAVNVSGTQLDGSLPGLVGEAVNRSEATAQQVVVEITETALADNRDTARQALRDLRALGVSVALDDFGTGYSSMAYLAELPVDRLKIDRSFVGSIGHSQKALLVVRALLQLSQSLGLQAVAEGVERLEQADILRGMDCATGQGYLYSRPLALPDLVTVLRVTDGSFPFEASRQ